MERCIVSERRNRRFGAGGGRRLAGRFGREGDEEADGVLESTVEIVVGKSRRHRLLQARRLIRVEAAAAQAFADDHLHPIGRFRNPQQQTVRGHRAIFNRRRRGVGAGFGE
jgi:hypothetical protein